MSNEIVQANEAETKSAIFSPTGLQKLQAFAEVMSQGVSTVPKHLAGHALTQGDEVTTLFTAPPVPEIKLPPEFNESHDSFNEFRRGWNGAISEVKRINGLGE